MRLPAPPPDQLAGRPFRSSEAAACGVTPDQLRGPAYRQLLPDVHVARGVPDSLELRCDAALLVMPPNAVLSHATAARLYGAPMAPASVVEICVPAGSLVPRYRCPWLRSHEATPAPTPCTWSGRPLATPELVWLQLAARLTLDGLVEVGDGLLRWTPATRDGFASAVSGAVRRRGVVRAREALPLLRERVDSAMETRLRLMLVRAGLPCPEPNVDARDAAGRWFARPDLSYPDLRIALEYEGDHHRTDQRQFRHDVLRDGLYDEHGWALVKVTADDLRWRASRVVRRVAAKLSERSAGRSAHCAGVRPRVAC